MKKRLLSGVVAVTMAASLLAGCSGGGGGTSSGDSGSTTTAASGGEASEAPAADAPKEEGDQVVKHTDVAVTGDSTDWKIAVVVKDLSNGWFTRMDAGVKQYAADTGINAYQKGPSATDAAQQVQVLQDVITQDIDALCVVPVDPAAVDPVLKQARDKGIKVIVHEGSTCENVDLYLEAFDNAGYGAFIMDKLQEPLGGKGVYTTMVAHLTNASQNEWADGAVGKAEEAYPDMKLLEAAPRVESENNSEKAYEVAKQTLKKYPEITGFVGTSSMDTPGIARAIAEMGLKDKVFVAGTGMPNECRQLLKDGSIEYITLWDPAEAGYAMCVAARMLLEGKEVGEGTDLGLESYSNLKVGDKPNFLQGAGWIAINADNVDEYDF